MVPDGRKLLKPDEVLGLSERIAITFTPGVPPIWTTLVRYYEESLVGSGRFFGSIPGGGVDGRQVSRSVVHGVLDRSFTLKERWVDHGRGGGFFEVMKDAIGACYGGTMERVVTQGAAELASALFGESNGYVAYGDGQKSIEVEAPQVEAPQVERGGMEM